MADPTGSGSNGGTTTVVSNPPNPPTTNTVPNTTTDTTTVQYQTAIPDPYGVLAAEDAQLAAEAAAQSDADAFGKLSVPRDSNGVLAAEDAQLAAEAAAQSDAEAYGHLSTTPVKLDDPLSGLTPDQIKLLGGADPTDPYIRARLGIPQLPGSVLNVTPGFGFGNLTTNLPSIDNALGTIKNLFSGTLGGGTGGGSGLSSLFTNFSATVGGLFGGTPTASTTAATTGTGVSALVATPNTITAKDTAGILASEDQALADQAAAQGDAEAFGKLATSPKSNTTLNAEQSDAFYNGTGTPTAAQVLAQDQQLAADAAKLYPGTKNQALIQIDKGYAAIEENTAGIANAEKIVAANNAELADPATSDARRAELLANNDEQQQYIQVATENTIINQNIIEQNANVYAAGGGNEGDGQTPNQVSALTDPGVAQAPVDPTTLEGFGVQAPVDPTTLEGYGIQATVDPTTIEGYGLPVDPAEDPFEAARLAAAAEDTGPLTETDVPVDPLTDDELAVQEAFQQDQRNALAETYGPDAVADPELIAAEEAALFDQQRVGPADPYGVLAAEDQAIADEQAAQSDAAAYDNLTQAPSDVLSDEDAALYDELANRADRNAAINTTQTSALVDQEQGSREAAFKAQANAQATRQARYKQPGNTDWRVRLSLAPGAKYLYNDGNQRSILAPLAADGGTDGVIFPYTPSITTTYSANYEQYDLTHSNYRGLFYKNSRVGDIQIRGVFTAQNTTEANYLLAVIHFFRSATKMFYGQDPQRGTPPPICLLNGFGGFQFSDHPVVISSFNYTLPNDVDYIRTTNPNNFGLNLNNRYNPAGASLPAGGSLAGLNRLVNALLPKGAQPQTPSPNTVVGSVTNNTPASYVPTKMEIDITLIPAQTRAQISKQFSLAGFANGDLLKGGFW
jgi:hypothetical protein